MHCRFAGWASFCPAALSGTTAGLLFDEYVERVCALGGSRMGPDATEVARRGRNRRGSHWHDQRHGDILPCRCRALFERKLGDDGRTLDGLDSITRHAHVSMAGLTAIGGDYR